MNQKLKTKLVALVAIICGNSFTQSHAMQADSEFLGYAPSSAVHANESGQSSSAFGSIRVAAPIGIQNQTKLPPIVSADSVSTPSKTPWQAGSFVPESVPMAIPKMTAHVPPIVTPDKLGTRIQGPSARPAPPIVSGEQMREMAFASPPKKVETKKRISNMLSPMMEENPVTPSKVEALARKIVSAPAPSLMDAAMEGPAPTVMQATTSLATEASGQVQQAAQWGPRGINAGYSSGGVPIYPQEGGIIPGQINAMPSVIESPMMPMQQSLPPIISSDSQLVSPVDPMIGPGAIPIAPAPAMQPQMMMQQQMMPAQPSFMSGESYIQAPMMDAPVMINSGCSSCDGGGCGSCSGGISNCQSCGDGGCFNEGTVANQFGCCGSVYSARRYVVADVLYMDREDGSVSNSNFGALGNFDWDLGWRVTLGTRADATRGQEISYMGTLGLEQDRQRVDPLGRLNSSFVSAGGFTGVESSAFRNGGATSAFRVTEQNEMKETAFHSLEFNKVKWGWDVIKTYIGLRYIYVDDSYEMFSRGNDGVAEQTGTFQMDALNNMIGPHIGGELFYDIGYRLSYSLLGKAGGYVNLNRVDTNLVNNGTTFLDVRDENVTLAGSLELGLIGHYQLSKQARLRFGYNVLWLGEVASVSDNFSPVLSPLTGSDTGDSDDMLFHGVSFGFEVYR